MQKQHRENDSQEIPTQKKPTKQTPIENENLKPSKSNPINPKTDDSNLNLPKEK